MDLLPNSMSFRFIATIDVREGERVPLCFTGRVRVAEAGRLTEVRWLSNGELDDPEPRIPALTRFGANGRTKQIRHYRQGRLHDPAPGVPAVVGSFADGSVKYHELYRYGRRHDAGERAAITKWRADGSVRTEHHYYEGLRIESVRRRLAG
ncbi:MAG: hypothetical protein ABIP17_14280 [Ilumatobacteraceae bacterium]